MADRGVVGTLDIYMDDGEGQQLVASLLQADLDSGSEMLPALHPTNASWKHYVPGLLGWRVDASMIQVADTQTIVRPAALIALETFYLTQTLLSFVFTSPLGTEYHGDGYIDRYGLGGAFDGGYSGSFGVQGVGPLTIGEADPVIPETTIEVYRMIPADITETETPGTVITNTYEEGAGGLSISIDGDAAYGSGDVTWYPGYFNHAGSAGLQPAVVSQIGDVPEPWGFVTMFRAAGADTQDFPYFGPNNSRVRIYIVDETTYFEIKSGHDGTIIKSGMQYNEWISVIGTCDDSGPSSDVYINQQLEKTFAFSQDADNQSMSVGWSGNQGLNGDTRGLIFFRASTVEEIVTKAGIWINYWNALPD